MPIARRRQEYRETLREEILDAARQLFVRDGYEATSMRAIASKAGCSAGILYHYFEDKQAIMARLVREAFVAMRQRLSAIRDDKAPAAGRLRRSLRAYIDFALDHPHHYSLLFSKPHEYRAMPDLHLAFSEEGGATFGCLRAVVREAIAEGVLRAELTDDDEVSQALWVSIHGFVSLQTNAKGFPWIERERLIERLLDVLEQGVLR